MSNQPHPKGIRTFTGFYPALDSAEKVHPFVLCFDAVFLCLPRRCPFIAPPLRLTQIPIAVVVTKIDICPPTVLKQTRQALAKYLRQNQKMPYPIKDISQASIVRCCCSFRFVSLADVRVAWAFVFSSSCGRPIF